MPEFEYDPEYNLSILAVEDGPTYYVDWDLQEAAVEYSVQFNKDLYCWEQSRVF